MTTQTWLLTGGAGYIGSHVADEFLASGKDVVIYDSLYQGLESRIEYLRKKYNKEIPLIVADIRDTDTFTKTLEQYKPYGIVHTAALKAVGESMEKPDEYFEVNFHATTKMLEIIASHNIHNFIFSSTAAVYGAPDHSNPIKEDDEKNPISPYGASKLAAEGEVNKFLALPGNHGTSLRFFNVVGTAAPELLDNSVENLVPIVINKLKAGQPPVIYGTDYPTPDGTCIRDYIHVVDLAAAHISALDYLTTTSVAHSEFNIGTGSGYSVKDVLAVVKEVTGFMGKPEVLPRRAGDPAQIVADVTRAHKELGWKSQLTLEDMVRSAWEASQSNS